MRVGVLPEAQEWIRSHSLEAKFFASCEMGHFGEGGGRGGGGASCTQLHSPALMAVQQSDTHKTDLSANAGFPALSAPWRVEEGGGRPCWGETSSLWHTHTSWPRHSCCSLSNVVASSILVFYSETTWYSCNNFDWLINPLCPIISFRGIVYLNLIVIVETVNMGDHNRGKQFMPFLN